MLMQASRQAQMGLYALALTSQLCFTAVVAAQAPEKKPTEAATRQYAAAAALQNREQYELAADEWATFLAKFPQDSRADRAQHYLGICQLKAKQYAAALESFDKVISTYPKFDLISSTWLHLGLAQYNEALAGKAELFPKAAETFSALVAKYPKGKEVPQALYYWGEALYSQGQKAEAVQRYADLAERYPKDPLVAEALYALGVTQEELGQPAAAGATYDAYLKQFSKLPLATEVSLRRAETMLAQGQFAPAEKLFAVAAGTQGFALADLATLRQATCLYEQRKYADAAALYAALPQRFPQSAHTVTAQLAAGKCLYLAGDLPAARAALAAAQAAGGEPAIEAAHWLVRSLLKEKQPAEALKRVDEVLPSAGQSTWAIQLELDRADALYDLTERRSESVAAYAAVAVKQPEGSLAPHALYMAGFAALELGQFEPALGFAGQFLQKFPEQELAPDVKYVAAESQLQLRKFDEAVNLYGELLAKYPQRPDAGLWQVRRAVATYLQKQYPETIAALEKALPGLKSKELQAEAHFLIGSSEFELKQYDAAAGSLAASLKAAPQWRQADEALLALANVHRQLNQVDAARNELADLVSRFPNSKMLDRAHNRLGDIAYAAGDFQTAAAEYRLVLEKYPDSPSAPYAFHELGWSQLRLQDAAGAVQSFTELLTRFAQTDLARRALYGRAAARQQLQEFGPAAEDLQAFLQTATTAAEKSDARYALALCQVGLKQSAEAAATLQTILTEDPQYAGTDKVLYERAWALQGQGLGADAAEMFGRLAKDFAASSLAAESLYHVGEFQYQQSDFKQAALAYYDAMQRAGKSQQAELGEKAAHKLGWAYYRLSAYDKAQQSFSYQRTTFPQGTLAVDAAFMEAESLFKQGKHADALSAYEQVKNPTNKEYAALALVHASQAAGQLKQWEKSLALAERATQEFPESEAAPEALYEQAWARQNLGQLDQSLPLYEAVVAKTDREVAARARFMVGEIYFEQKNHAEAIKNFFKVAYGYSYPQWQANAHYEAGRCFEVLKKSDQAKKSYQEIVDKFPESDKASLAKQRLEALDG